MEITPSNLGKKCIPLVHNFDMRLDKFAESIPGQVNMKQEVKIQISQKFIFPFFLLNMAIKHSDSIHS